MARTEVWFNPIIEPTKALNPPKSKVIFLLQPLVSIILIRKAKGGIFCHAKRINIGAQFNPTVTLGTQKCIGKIPSLINKLEIKIN